MAKQSPSHKLKNWFLGLGITILIASALHTVDKTKATTEAKAESTTKDAPDSPEVIRLKDHYTNLFNACCWEETKQTSGRRKGFHTTGYSLNRFEATARRQGFTLINSSHLEKTETGHRITVSLNSISTDAGWQVKPEIAVE